MGVQDLLNEVRALDESTKTKVLVASTVVIMAIVIFVWLAYFNSIVMPSAASFADLATTTAAGVTTTAPIAVTPPAPAPASAQAVPSGSGFLASIQQSFAAAWQGFIGMFGAQTQYIKPAGDQAPSP